MMNPGPVSFIAPLKITAAMITSSTAVTKLAGEVEWDATTNYAIGTVVFRAALGRRFENQIAGVNANKPEDDADRWYDLGSTDKTTMFDGEVSTQSIAPNALTTVFRPGAFNAIYLAGLDGQSIELTVREAPGGNVVYSYVGSLEDSEPIDYYEYYFAPYKPKTDFFATDIAPFVNCEVTLSIFNAGGVARCGMAALGDLTSLGGPALKGVTVEPKSYARIVVDSRGKTSVKKGKAAKDMAISAQVPIAEADGVVDALTSVLGVPCACIGTDLTNYRTLRTFGLMNGKFAYNNELFADLSMTVQGMI